MPEPTDDELHDAILSHFRPDADFGRPVDEAMLRGIFGDTLDGPAPGRPQAAAPFGQGAAPDAGPFRQGRDSGDDYA